MRNPLPKLYSTERFDRRDEEWICGLMRPTPSGSLEASSSRTLGKKPLQSVLRLLPAPLPNGDRHGLGLCRA